MSLMHRIKQIEAAPKPAKRTHAKSASVAAPPRKGAGGRPKAADPLKPVTLRIPQSWLDEWAAKGEDWRALMRERLRP